MTIKEKNRAISVYCKQISKENCTNCKLNGQKLCFTSEEDVDDYVSDIERNYETILIDAVNPSYYKGKIEVIDFIEAYDLGFCLGNCVKYISRAGKKDPNKEIEDLRKAEYYLQRRIKELDEK